MVSLLWAIKREVCLVQLEMSWMLAEEVQATVQMSIRYTESQECSFLLNPLLCPGCIPLWFFRFTWKLIHLNRSDRSVWGKLVYSNVSNPVLVYGVWFFLIHVASSFFLPFFKENHIIYSAISRKHCGWAANGEAALDAQLANLKISWKWCMSTITNVAVQW